MKVVYSPAQENSLVPGGLSNTHQVKSCCGTPMLEALSGKLVLAVSSSAV